MLVKKSGKFTAQGLKTSVHPYNTIKVIKVPSMGNSAYIVCWGFVVVDFCDSSLGFVVVDSCESLVQKELIPIHQTLCL